MIHFKGSKSLCIGVSLIVYQIMKLAEHSSNLIRKFAMATTILIYSCIP